MGNLMDLQNANLQMDLAMRGLFRTTNPMDMESTNDNMAKYVKDNSSGGKYVMDLVNTQMVITTKGNSWGFIRNNVRMSLYSKSMKDTK